MPLFELVLDFEGPTADEVRLTHLPVVVGDTVQVDDEAWEVVRELPRGQRHHARFQCKRAKHMSERHREKVLASEDLQRRMADQRARRHRPIK